MKQALRCTAAALLAGLTYLPAAQAAEVPRTAFVHLFEWSWPDIATECETFLGPKGFSAVQVSPPNKHIDGGAWWTRYQPVSYAFESRSGNRSQFADMVQRCKAAGVDIYVDAVINHMAAWDRNFPEVPYGGNDFHSCTSEINYGDRWMIQNCDLSGLNDLKTESEYVRQKIADYMNDAISMGVAGFRIDAAKHMPATDIAAIKTKLNGNPYIFQEVIGAHGEPVQPGEYTYIGDVTEFNFERTIGDKFQGGGISALGGIGSWSGWLDSSNAVVFVANHDDERHNEGATLTHLDQGDLYYIGNIFMLAYPYGYPKVMSGYYFGGNFDQGPPSSGVHSGNACGFDGGDWVCEHKWRGIANMVGFRNHTAAEWRVTDWWDNGYNQIAFGRGGLGFVVVNRDDNQSVDRTFQTGMPAGEYCDIVNGDYIEATQSCDGPTVTVHSDGTAHFTVGQIAAAAIHVGAEVDPIPCSGDSCPCSGPGCVDVDEPAEPVTATNVCFNNEDNFASPTMYYWGALPSGALANANWPGVTMTANGDFYCHDLGVTLSSINIIFNDSGANQTADLTAPGAGCYQNGSWKSLEDCGFTIEGTKPKPEPTGATKVCYDNAANLSQPTLYYWSVDAESAVANATWPGVAMQQEQGVYCYDFGVELYSLNAIFNSNGANQTADLSATAPDLCYANGAWTGLDNCQASDNQGDEQWYFRGTANAWGTTLLGFDASSGLYCTVQSFNGEESPARFKIDVGDWTESYPSQDYQVDDFSTYQICFNSLDKQISVTKQ